MCFFGGLDIFGTNKNQIMPKSEVLSRIVNLISRLSKCQDEIRKKGGSDKFDHFVGNKQPGLPGIKRSNRAKRMQDLRRLRKEISADNNHNPDLQIVESAENLIIYLEEKLKEYIEQNNVNVSEIINSFFVYFFYMEKRSNEPELGRAVLHIKSNNNVEFISIHNNESKNYNGTGNYAEEKTYVLNLSSKESTLYIKIYSKDISKKELNLGAYVTFDNNHIIEGALILTPIEETDVPKPKIMSFIRNKEEFEKVDPYIKQYISLKKYNHNTIPEDIRSVYHLDRFLNKQYKEKTLFRFIENSKPILYLAFPNSSVDGTTFRSNKSRIIVLKEHLNKSFPDKLEIEFATIQYHSPLHKATTAPPSLNTLKRTRYFILVYTKTSSASLCLVQLGWALAYCKKVFVFYEKESISSNIERLSATGVKMVPIDNTDEGFVIVKEVLIKAIGSDLKEFLFHST